MAFIHCNVKSVRPYVITAVPVTLDKAVEQLFIIIL